MEKVTRIIGDILVGTGVLVALIIAISTTSFAATKIDPNGIGDHEYTEIFKNATDEDIEALEKVVYHEAGQCTDWRVRLAVIETVCNRVLSDEWGDSIAKVCKQKNQFVHRAIPKSATEEELEGVGDAIEYVVHEGRTVLPDTDYVYFAIGKQKEAKNHILVGDGTRKWQFMHFGQAKE